MATTKADAPKAPESAPTPDAPKAPEPKPSKKSTPVLSGNVSKTIHGHTRQDF